jgi:dihydrofolate reductase
VAQIVYYVAASLDGYIAPPDGSLDWLASHEANTEDYGYAEFYASVDAVLVGRRTYEQCLAFPEWPYPGKPCWAFSHRPLKAASKDITITAESPQCVAALLLEREVRRAWLVGGGELAGSFRAAQLITEYVVTVLPVVLGGGTPLFAVQGPKEDLKLMETRKFSGGLVQMRYRR